MKIKRFFIIALFSIVWYTLLIAVLSLPYFNQYCTTSLNPDMFPLIVIWSILWIMICEFIRRFRNDKVIEHCKGEPCEYGGNCPNYGHPEIWCYFKPDKENDKNG